ncbi:MAG: glutamate-5-semialdehyde dehydrogenase [Nitrosomonadales bacterium]|jgi:glutamate-5-semialdehyde dehydrogenase|nr:glutamate-5-semialdehyde dehydrogenase [Nitrosomonadales bacterium]MBT4570914.1 glutamate-5-semialdehyde dehydrogenase [Nitrosomonadales bacterium]MBT4759153.1 glutamate-5-semialdehyde dehydrogenase [Nitrosomonadales bacterium]MBT5150671.1 glutamate-5-semialdehyde dehydrogenase [Nitrosomonadales bacterium]MBT5572717.1 glutamate-5-semialdehyde dehydrogenase [Nitrosomonadales bacterium]
MDEYMRNLGVNARNASHRLSYVTSKQKNMFLELLAKSLEKNQKNIIKANSLDLLEANKRKLDAAFIDRMTLTESNIRSMCDGLLQVKSLEDLIGKIVNRKKRPSGIEVCQMRVPIGVIGMIYESRPNVTIDSSALTIKAGNAIILRGGSETINSNKYLGKLITHALVESGLPEKAVQIIESTDRMLVDKLITMDEFVDVIIPRGGKSLIQKITNSATIPVIKHLDGNCHIYVDEFADINKAVSIVDNSKTQRLGTCNTLESLVVSSQVAEDFLPKINEIFNQKNIEMRGCKKTKSILNQIKLATDEDYYEEYLGPYISIIIVNSLEEAIQHINKYSSKHTEAIITENETNALEFIKAVDSSSVMINASTRFADGFEYGLGAEIGISTDKIHARGPVGLEGLTSLKYIVFGQGEIRQ